MKPKLLVLFFVLAVFVLVFIWGLTNYTLRHTDTPESLAPELYVQNIDVFAVPAVFAAFAIIGIIPVITWMLASNRKQGKIFVVLSSAGIFLLFVVLLKWIIEN